MQWCVETPAVALNELAWILKAVYLHECSSLPSAISAAEKKDKPMWSATL